MTSPTGGGRYVDLHSHSTASDGSAPPARGVEAAHRAGLAALALTDHDTMAGVAEAERTAAELGIRLVVGTELSAHDGDREVHLLALHISDRPLMERALVRFREQRTERAAEIVRKLQGMGLDVSMDGVLEAAAGGAVGRPHVARAMIAAGVVRDTAKRSIATSAVDVPPSWRSRTCRSRTRSRWRTRPADW